LTEALNATVVDETGSESKDVVQDAKGLKTIGKNLFLKVEDFDNGNWSGINPFDSEVNSKMSPKYAFANGNYEQTIGLRFFPTDNLKAELKKKTITDITAQGTFTMEYRGPGPSAGHGTMPIGTKVVWNIEKVNMNTKNLADGADSIRLNFSLKDPDQKLATNQSFDTSDTSKWNMTLLVNFKVDTAKQNSTVAEQVLKIVIKNKKWDEAIEMHNFETFVPKGK
jgi:hypothetical protein